MTAKSPDPLAFLAELGERRHLAQYNKNDVIFAQGTPADTVFFIKNGLVKLTIVSARGQEAVVAIFGRNAFFGESCLAGQERRVSTATAMTRMEAVQIPMAAIAEAIRDKPAFAEILIAYLLHRAIRSEADFVDQLFNSSERRLARLLLLLANYDDPVKSGGAVPHVSQEMLAEMIGTTRSRVSFFMNKFRRQGFITYNGSISVHSSLQKFLATNPPVIAR